MMEQIKIFLFVLSVVYSLKVTITFGIKLTQDNPEPMTLSKIEQTVLLFAISFIITYFLI